MKNKNDKKSTWKKLSNAWKNFLVVLSFFIFFAIVVNYFFQDKQTEIDYLFSELENVIGENRKVQKIQRLDVHNLELKTLFVEIDNSDNNANDKADELAIFDIANRNVYGLRNKIFPQSDFILKQRFMLIDEENDEPLYLNGFKIIDIDNDNSNEILINYSKRVVSGWWNMSIIVKYVDGKYSIIGSKPPQIRYHNKIQSESYATMKKEEGMSMTLLDFYNNTELEVGIEYYLTWGIDYFIEEKYGKEDSYRYVTLTPKDKFNTEEYRVDIYMAKINGLKCEWEIEKSFYFDSKGKKIDLDQIIKKEYST